jgi:Sporulation and spore germination
MSEGPVMRVPRAARSLGRPARRRLLTLLFGALGLCLFVFALSRLGGGRRPSAGDGGGDAAASGDGTRAYTLHFLDARGQLVSERRDVVAKPSATAQVAAVVSELLEGSLGEHQSAIPEGTVLRHVFVEDTGLVTLDLSREILRKQPGSLEAEYATLAALVRSVKISFPEVTSIQILVDGKPEPTLAGHFATGVPLSCDDWLEETAKPEAGSGDAR